MKAPHSLSVGIDIGTTSVSAVVVDTALSETLEAYTVPHHAAISSADPWDKRQNAAKMIRTAAALLDEIRTVYPDIQSIGLTGQMHGIVYLDQNGKLLSDLYTWQDGRAGLRDGAEGRSICQELKDAAGYSLSPGYGLATHSWLLKHGQVPAGADKLCTIMDYAAAFLCGTSPVLHASNAASLGFFDPADHQFDREALKIAGIDPSILPPIVSDDHCAGYWHNIPVAVAIGDNQASVFGSLGTAENAVLVNFGTGSQVSVICSEKNVRFDQQSSAETAGQTASVADEPDIVPSSVPSPDIEIRPYFSGQVLLCGSALCGGRAYAIMEQFFRQYALALGLKEEEQYSVMNRLVLSGLDRIDSDPSAALNVETTFSGTRTDPDLRGMIANISENNFTPDLLLAGTLYGMVQELYEMYAGMKVPVTTLLAASGNAVRKNPALIRVIQTVFGLKPQLSTQKEEAAYGSALFAFKALNKRL